MLITIGEAVAYVVSGMYGDVRELGAINATLIILQVHSWRTLLQTNPPASIRPARQFKTETHPRHSRPPEI